MRSITVREANQTFARILKETPRRHDRETAIERIVAPMRAGLALGGRHFSRDEMHER